MKDATEIIVIIDESASMQKLTKETVASFNNFLKEQKALPDKATMSLTFFNTVHRQPYICANLKDIKPLDRNSYTPNDYTALLDAVGSTIDSVGTRLAALCDSDRPCRVVVVIITDGEENSSKEYSLDQVKNKIKEQQEKYSWKFIFLGANQDAFTVAGGLSIPCSNAMKYPSTGLGVQTAYRAAGQSVSSYRGGGSVAIN